MKTIKSDAERRNRYLKFLRFLAIAAFICTALLSVIIVIEGALPGKASGAQSNFVTDTLQSIGKGEQPDETLTTSRILVMPDARYAGEAAPIPVKFYPAETADKDLVYSSSDESVATVNEYGTVFYHKYGNSIIKASLKSNPEICDYANVLCYGTKPENVTDLRAEDTSVPIGTSPSIKIFDSEGNGVSAVVFEIESDDESVLKIYDDRVAALKEGSANLIFRYPKTGFIRQVRYTAVANPSFVRPQNIVLRSDSLDVMAGDEIDIDKLLADITPDGASWDFDLQVETENGLNILTRRTPHIFTANRFGKATVTLTSFYNPQCRASLNINVGEAVPSQISVVCNPRAVVDTKLQLTAYGDSDYVYNVNWKVVKGNASIDGNGVFMSKRLGNVTVRVTSNADPSVFAEYTLRVSLFSTFKAFVRKFIGHFLLFAILGFGLSSCAILLMKKGKYLFPVISLTVGFILAGISEALQLPIFTTGRVASWTDILIDVIGVICGTAAVAIIVLLYALIKKKADKGGYALAKEALSKTHFKSVFTKSGALASASEDEYGGN